MTDCVPTIFSIGHSNHPLETFIQLLRTHAIDVLVDVRSQPYSRYAQQFSAEVLKHNLPPAGVRYLFLGRELGGRPEGREFYDADGYVLYDRVARSARFKEGIARLETGIRRYRVAMMCSEEDPTDCHRRLLVGRVLQERGINVNHIRGDGGVQSEAELARSLKGDLEVEQLPLFGVAETKPWRSTRSVLRSEPRPISSEP